MRMHVAGVLLLCALAACERKAAAPVIDGARAGARPAPVAVTKGRAPSAGGFGDAWSLRALPVLAPPARAPVASNPHKEMQSRIAKFRAARLRAQQGKAQAVHTPAEPAMRPGDLVGQRAGDRASRQASDAEVAGIPLPAPAIGITARAAYDPSMNSRIERFRAAQLSRNDGAVPNRPDAVPGILASTRPGDSPGRRPGDLAPPR